MLAYPEVVFYCIFHFFAFLFVLLYDAINVFLMFCITHKSLDSCNLLYEHVILYVTYLLFFLHP